MTYEENLIIEIERLKLEACWREAMEEHEQRMKTFKRICIKDYEAGEEPFT